MSRVDVLAVGAHPDDVELGCGGTIRKLVVQGYRVGIVDLTEGELGSRGSVETRRSESKRASEILGIHERVNLGLPDGDIQNSKENQLSLIGVIRRWRPHIVLLGAPECRHPDHAAATELAAAAVFHSGLSKVVSPDVPEADPWRPPHVLHYMQSLTFEPTLVVDVSDTWQARMAALRSYATQFHTGEASDAAGPATYISTSGFLAFIEGRARSLGYRVGAEYGEGFLYRQGPFGVDDLVATLAKERVS